MKPAAIELSIDRLILEGIDEGLQTGVVQALQRELSRLIEAKGIPENLLNSDGVLSLSAEGLRAKCHVSPERIGLDLAMSLYESLGGPHE